MTGAFHRYEVIGTLGKGATSRVDKARDAMIGRTVAVKTFLSGFGSEDIQKQFLREAQIIGRLTHPYIVGLYDVGTNEEGVPYLVMEYIEGKTLETTLDAGRLPLERAAVWAGDLASALARAHQLDIIHGDVKPANVLITAEGQVKLGDFGIARFATQISGSGSVLGTPAYLSPEQIQGHKQDKRSDLFSLGIVLYQMATGVRPFDGTSVGAVCAQIVSADPPPPSHYHPELPPEFDHVVMRCLAKDPANRYGSAEALGASLYPFARGKTFDGPLKTPSSWWKRPVQGNDLRVAAGVVATLAILGAGAGTALHHRYAKPSNGAAAMGHATAGGAAVPRSTGMLPTEPAATLMSVNDPDMGAVEQLPTDWSTSPVQSNAPSVDDSSSKNSDARSESQGKAPVSRATLKHSLASTKANSTHAVAGSDAETVSGAGASASGSHTVGAATNKGAKPAAVAKSSLYVDIVSNVADERLLVYAGEELLLSAPLRSEHLGDTLRFDCPVTPGEHSFRVVLARPDDSVMLEKESTSQIRADGSNFLGVHITRKAKLLVKHEIALEVVWPSAVAPLAPIGNAVAKDAVAMR